MSPGLFNPESTYDSHETFFAKFSQVTNQEEGHEERMENIASARKEQEAKLKEFRKQARELKTNMEKVNTELEKLQQREDEEMRGLVMAKVQKKNVLDRADPGIKRALEFGMDMGRKESDRKRAKIAHGKD